MLALLAAALLLAIMSGSGQSANAQSGGGFPSAKAAVAIDHLVALTQAKSNSGGVIDSDGQEIDDSSTTDWIPVLSTQIKTSEQKDLNMIAALQTGVVTDNTVSSKNGGLSVSTARGTVSVMVTVDGEMAEPTHSINADTVVDAQNPALVDGVVYQDRVTRLEARFSGFDCTADDAGVVTCAEEEYLSLLQESINAGSFNFVAMDVGSGVHDVIVYAKAAASSGIVQDDTAGGTLAGAEAFAGAGSLLVEEVRYQKGEDPLAF